MISPSNSTLYLKLFRMQMIKNILIYFVKQE